MKKTLILIVVASLFVIGSAQAADPVVVLKTNYGDIKVKLNEDKAPITVKNFLSYADKKFYDGTIFHRVIDGFMIQGGGLDPDLTEKETGKPIKNEASNGLSNKKYTIAMARTPEPDSATSQFFINTADNSRLDYNKERRMAGYCVFGEVIAGKEVVDKINKVRTGRRGFHQNVPVEAVIIKSVRRESK